MYIHTFNYRVIINDRIEKRWYSALNLTEKASYTKGTGEVISLLLFQIQNLM